jgi:prepilin-type N-terminal cleavage/methylation domain-containing protein
MVVSPLSARSPSSSGFLPVHYSIRTHQTCRAHESLCFVPQGFTLVEVMMAMAVTGIMLVVLHGGLAYGFKQVQLAREDERATQILAERMEVVRLLSWDQLVNLPGYVPTNFTESYSVFNPSNAPARAQMYTGTVSVVTAPISESYSNDLLLIQLTLAWQSGGLTHQRTMTTFSSRYGLQNYVY